MHYFKEKEDSKSILLYFVVLWAFGSCEELINKVKVASMTACQTAHIYNLSLINTL